MAKTKAQIKTDITSKFVTNGNIRAVDTSAALHDILDCPELNDKGDLTGIQNKLIQIEGKNGVQDARLDDLEKSLMQNAALRFSFEVNLQNEVAKAFFSFRGFKSHFVNITMRIRLSKNFVGPIQFKNEQLAVLKPYLEGIIDDETNHLYHFLVTIVNKNLASNNNTFKIGNLNLQFIENTVIEVRLQNFLAEHKELMAGDEISTSIAIHSSVNINRGS